MHVDLEPPYLVVKEGVTEEDFYRLADEDSNWEYLDGRIVVHSPASFRHEDLFSFLIAVLRAYSDETRLGKVLGSRFPMRLDEHWSPEPDLMVIRSERVPLIGKQRLEGPADLVVEIVSEGKRHLIFREKLPRYREAAIPEVWVVDPYRSEILVETATPAGTKPRTVTSGRLDSTVLPGFWLQVEWLWQETLPSALRCAQEILASR